MIYAGHLLLFAVVTGIIMYAILVSLFYEARR